MAALASVSDVELRWKPGLTSPELDRVAAALDDASAVVRRRFPLIDSRIADGFIEDELVRGVVANMVVRYMRNPEGKQSERIDDYSYTRQQAHAAGALVLLPEEAELLGGRRRRVRSVRLRSSVTPKPGDIDYLASWQ
jgi:hypothetical protein